MSRPQTTNTMRHFIALLLPFVVIACSDTNAPDDAVTDVEICRDCGDDRTVVVQFQNGRPLPYIDPIADGDCETLDLSGFTGAEFTGADTLELRWGYDPEDADSGRDDPRRRLLLPLSSKSHELPCL